jgi:acyl-CoA synthetase (AMP-forming)/AMP-acid ligase II
MVRARPGGTGGDRRCGHVGPAGLPRPRVALGSRAAQGWSWPGYSGAGSGYLAAIFACARLGALAIHINTRFRTAEVGSLLRRSRAVALVTEWGFPPVDFPAIFAALPAEDRAGLRCVLGLRVPRGVTQLAGLPVLSLDGAAADAGPDEATGEKPCLTFTTSGTTAGPKLVLHAQQAIAGHAADVARRIGLDAATRFGRSWSCASLLAKDRASRYYPRPVMAPPMFGGLTRPSLGHRVRSSRRSFRLWSPFQGEAAPV